MMMNFLERLRRGRKSWRPRASLSPKSAICGARWLRCWPQVWATVLPSAPIDPTAYVIGTKGEEVWQHSIPRLKIPSNLFNVFHQFGTFLIYLWYYFFEFIHFSNYLVIRFVPAKWFCVCFLQFNINYSIVLMTASYCS